MGQVRVLSAKVFAARVAVPATPVALSTLFRKNGAILFQNNAARDDFAAPKETKRAVCAFIRHFADRAEGRRLLDRAAAGEASRVETLVHTVGGVAPRIVEISPATGPDDEPAIMLNERALDPPATSDPDAELARVFAQAGADWFWETDADGRITLVSDRPDLSKTSASADFVGRLIDEPLPGIDDLDYIGLRQAVDQREFFRDFRYTRRDREGRRRHFSVSGAPFFAPDGAFLGYRGTGRDRTRSVEAEEQAATAQARLIAAIESIPEAFILFDRNNRLVMCNSRFREENPAIADRLRAGTPVKDLAAAARRAGLTVPAIDYVAESQHDGSGHAAIERQAGQRWFQLGARRPPEGGLAVVQTDVTALKQREAELAEKSALLQATLDNMHQGVLVNDANVRVVMWNDRFLEMNGLTADMIRVGMPAAELVRNAAKLGEYGAGDADTAAARRLEQLRGNITDRARIRPNGAVIEHHTNRMPGGMVIRTFTDITALKEQERHTEDQRRLLAATLGNMDQGMLVLDADLRIKLWNGRMLDLLHVPEGICRVGMTLAELIAAMRRAQNLPTEGFVDQVTARLKDFSLSNTVVMAPENFDGRSIERRRRPLPDGGMVLTYTDVTDARRRERQVEESGQLLRATLDNMDQGIMVLDADGKVRMWNERLVEQYSLPPDFIRVGMPMAEVVEQLARQGELGEGDPAKLTKTRLVEIGGDSGRVFSRQLKSGRVIERRRRDMPDGGSVLTHTDITALSEREREVARQHGLVSGTLANVDQGILVLDARLRLVLWNDRLVELLNLPANFCRVGVPLEDMVALFRAREGLPNNGVAAGVAARVKDLTRDHVITLPPSAFGGRVLERRRRGLPDGGIVLTYTDISEAKRHEQEIAEKSALLATTLESMDQGIMVIGGDRTIRMWNSRVVTQHNLPADFLRVGLPASEMIMQLARQGEYGPGDPERIGKERLSKLNKESGVFFERRHSNGSLIERRRRPMPDGGTVLTYTDITDLTERERALEEKSTLLSATLDNMDQGMMVLDAELNIRTWNSRAIELLNLPPDLIHAGMPVRDVIRYLGQRGGRSTGPLEDRVEMRMAEYRGGTARIMADVVAGRIIERRSRPMPDGGLVVTYADITELSERERALDEKSTHLSAVLGSMDQGMIVLDSETNIRTWNERVVELLNLTADTLRVGMPIADLIRLLSIRMGLSPSEIEQSVATRVDEFVGGEPRLLGGPTLDGRVVERRSQKMPDGGVIITYNDVTERTRREDVIAENSALLGATLDNMDQGLVVVDADNRAKLWNNRLIEMFNLPPDVMRVGRPFRDIVRYFLESAGTPPDQVEQRLAERMVELEGEPLPVIDRHRPDGRVIERRRRVMPAGGSVITYGDVTARKRGEAALQRAKDEAEIASRSKTEFLANMSHELRTPLNAIIGFSDILVRQLFGPLGTARYAEYARDIHDSGEHLLNLINDVLDISKIEVNKIDLVMENVDVPAVIESCLRLMRDRATAAGVTIDVSMPDLLPPLRGDDRRLKQILLNLVSNAVKFTPAGGRVEILVEADESGFRFAVADTGIGIAKADIETAMRPFGQIDSSLARRYQGTGLGLPLARSMAELHGGKLDIESEPGAGTTVTVWLPPTAPTKH